MRGLMRYYARQYRADDTVFMMNSAQYAHGYYHGYFGMDPRKKVIHIIVDDKRKTSSFIPQRDIKAICDYYNKEGYDLGRLAGKNIDILIEENRRKSEHNPRSWIIMAHAHPLYQSQILNYFDRRGRRLEERVFQGCSLYLYDLSAREDFQQDL